MSDAEGGGVVGVGAGGGDAGGTDVGDEPTAGFVTWYSCQAPHAIRAAPTAVTIAAMIAAPK